MIKRGQITIFIILGAVILLILGGAVFFLQYSSKSKLETQKEQTDVVRGEAAAVKVFVESCLKKTLQEAILHIAEYGGYYQLPEISSQKAYKNAPFYFYKGKKLVPSKEEVENAFSQFIFYNVSICLNDFKSFPFEITSGEAKVESNLGKGAVSVKLNLPLEINLLNKKINLDTFQIVQNSPLYLLWESSEKMADSIVQYNGGICLDCLNELAEKNKFELQIVEFNKNETFFILSSEKKITGKNESVNWRFAVRYG